MYEVGSRQWGSAQYDVDLSIGTFNEQLGTHDGVITFNVMGQTQQEQPSNQDTEKRLIAHRAIIQTMRNAKQALNITEMVGRSTGIQDKYLKAMALAMIDDGVLVEDRREKPSRGGKVIVYYTLTKEAL
jgi:hypothetical protein